MPTRAALPPGANEGEEPGVEKESIRRLQPGSGAQRQLYTVMRKSGSLFEAIDCIEWVAECLEYYAELAGLAAGLRAPVAPNR